MYKIHAALKLTLFLTLVLTIAPNVQAYTEFIERFNTVIRVGSGGKIYVQEEIWYDFGAQNRHGIFRTIPFRKTNQEGKKFNMNIEDFAVFDEDGLPYNFTTSKSNGEITLKIGDPDLYVTGRKLYEINYTVSGAITYFSDHDELFWNFTGNDWDVPILKSVNTLILPNDISYKDVQTACYTGSYGSTEVNCDVGVPENGILISSRDLIAPGEGLSGVIGFPKGFIAVLEPTPDNSDLISILIAAALAIAAILWYFIYPARVFWRRYQNKKYLKDNQRIVAAWFDPPKDDYEDYTPAETGMLIDKVPDQKEVTATIINLAQRGYLKIIPDGKDFVFNKQKGFLKDIGLKKYETLILEGLFDGRELVNTKDLAKDRDFGKKITKFMTEVEKALESKDLFDDDLSKAKLKNGMLYGLGAITFNINLIIAAFIFRNHYIRFNKKGVEKFSETASLKNFLVSQDEQLDYQADKLMFFERLLPYATAFGVEDVWAKRFKDILIEQTDWYEGDLANAAAMSNISRSVNSSVVKAMTYSSTSSSSGFSSGFSGGGFSGGGGGGGGGGSW